MLLFVTYLKSLTKHYLLLEIFKLMACQICSSMNLEKNFTWFIRLTNFLCIDTDHC